MVIWNTSVQAVPFLSIYLLKDMQITNNQGQTVLYVVALVTDSEVHYAEVARVTLTNILFQSLYIIIWPISISQAACE